MVKSNNKAKYMCIKNQLLKSFLILAHLLLVFIIPENGSVLLAEPILVSILVHFIKSNLFIQNESLHALTFQLTIRYSLVLPTHCFYFPH